MRVPYPGSAYAEAHGCPCPPQPYDCTPARQWWIDPTCPVHGWPELQETK